MVYILWRIYDTVFVVVLTDTTSDEWLFYPCYKKRSWNEFNFEFNFSSLAYIILNLLFHFFIPHSPSTVAVTKSKKKIHFKKIHSFP